MSYRKSIGGEEMYRVTLVDGTVLKVKSNSLAWVIRTKKVVGYVKLLHTGRITYERTNFRDSR